MPLPARLAALAALLALLAAPAAGAPALEVPELLEGTYWSYALLGPDGEPRGDEATVNVSVEGSTPNGTRVVEVRTSFTRPVRNGSFDVTTRTRLEVQAGGVGVLARESVTVRDGQFQGRSIWSYSRNVTKYDEPLPLLAAPSNPGDLWRTDTRARAVVNQTDVVGSGNDSRRVESGPRRANFTVNETLRVQARENVTVPAGTLESVRVNRTGDREPGYTLEWWAPEVGYMARWATYGPDGNRTGGAALQGHGRLVPPDGGIDWTPWIVGGAAAALLAGAGAWAGRRRGA